MGEIGLNFYDLSAVTSDTTASSINVFDDVSFVDIAPCFGHKGNLFLKLGSKSSSVLKKTFAVCREIMVRLDGKKSHLRKIMLEKACADSSIAYRKPIHPGATRFGSHEKTGTRALYLRPAIERIQAADFTRSTAAQDDEVENDEDDEINTRTSWLELKRNFSDSIYVLEFVLPLFREVEQWTQILSSNTKPTISKARLACRRISQHIADMRSAAEEMERGRCKDELTEVVDELESARHTHLGHDYYDFSLLRVAEFLDVEVFHTLSAAEVLEMQPLLANFLAESDCESPKRIDERKKAASFSAARGGSRQAGGVRRAPELSEQQRMMAALREGMVLSQINPLQREIADYVDVVLTIDPDDRDTLGFWVENEIRFPILAKVARRTLCISATSCDVERLFSRAGLICTKLRSRLAPNTILCLSALHYHYSEEENISASRRSVDASARAQRFAKLTSALLVESHESYISDSDSDEDGEN